MVVLNKIYTRTGDGGETALGNGARVAKHSARVAAYGTVDETNAAVGLAASEAVNPAAVIYLNRVSDWFFVASRVANGNGAGDVLWVPGANRRGAPPA